MNQQEQIDYLNSTVKCKLAPSPIHGIGVFAMGDIEKGQKCHCVPDFFKGGMAKWYHTPYGSLKKLFPEIRALVLERWPSIINGSKFLSPNDMVWLLTYVNHSEEPNFDPTADTALKDIKKGDEIVQDYRRMENYQDIYPWLDKKI